MELSTNYSRNNKKIKNCDNFPKVSELCAENSVIISDIFLYTSYSEHNTYYCVPSSIVLWLCANHIMIVSSLSCLIKIIWLKVGQKCYSKN